MRVRLIDGAVDAYVDFIEVDIGRDPMFTLRPREEPSSNQYVTSKRTATSKRIRISMEISRTP